MPDRKWLLALLAIVLFGAGLYSNALHLPFVFDDLESIVHNPNARQLDDLGQAIRAPGGTGASGRPLVALTLAWNYAASGLDPFGYRVFNVTAHILAAWMLFLLALRTARHASARRALSFASALGLLWVAHPLHTAAIDHVIYRNETLVALFFFATLYAAQRGFESGRSAWFTLSVCACALGMATKENMAAAPLGVLLWQRTFHSAERMRPVFYAALTATYGVLLWSISLGDRGESVGFGARGVESLDYLATQAFVLLHYLKLTVWPQLLVLEYSDWPIESGFGRAWMPGLGLLALLLLSIRATWQKQPAGLLGLIAFAVLAPTSSFLPIAGAPAAEHRMVLPLAALIAIALILAARATRVNAVTGLAFVVAAGFGARTWLRNADYQTTRAIWEKTIAARPTNTLAYEHLTAELTRLGLLAEAESAYRASLEIDPDQPKASYNFGLLLNARGRPIDAEPYFTRAIALDPSLPLQQFHFGWRSLELGNAEGGIANMQLALAQDPALLERERVRQGVMRMAWCLSVASEPRLFQPQVALEWLNQLDVRMDPSARSESTRALAYAATGRLGDAIQTAQNARQAAQAEGDTQLAGEIAAYLDRMQRGEPIRVKLTTRP